MKMWQRSSGVLMHVSSIPSNYGIGDFGPQTYTFIDYICYDKVRQVADKLNHSYQTEIKVLLSHALLHFAGYDHKTAKQRQIMEKQEKKLLSTGGLLKRG